MKSTLIIIASLVLGQLISQDLRFLDSSFGQDGVLEIKIKNISHAYIDGCEDDDGLYLVDFHIDEESDGSSEFIGQIMKIDDEGRIISEFADNGALITPYKTESGHQRVTVSEGHLWKYIVAEDQYIVERYDCDNVFEKEYISDNINSSNYATRLPINNGELLSLDNYQLTWMDISGTPKPDFGTDGKVNIRSIMPGKDRYELPYFGSHNMRDEIIIKGYDGNYQDVEFARILSDGTLDFDFGVNGYLVRDDNISFGTIMTDHKDGYFMYDDKLNSLRLNNDGSLDTAFNKFRELEFFDFSDTLNFISQYFGQFDNGYTLWYYNNYLDYSTPSLFLDLSLYILDEKGNFQYDFGDEGFIKLISEKEFFHNIYINSDNEVYLLFLYRDDIDSEQLDGVRIKKLNANLFENIFSISNAGEDHSFNIYPNPTDNMLNIEYNGNGISDVKVLIHDSLGRLVWEEDISVIYPGEKIEILDQNNLENGVYYLTFERESKQVDLQYKFIKVN